MKDITGAWYRSGKDWILDPGQEPLFNEDLIEVTKVSTQRWKVRLFVKNLLHLNFLITEYEWPAIMRTITADWEEP